MDVSSSRSIPCLKLWQATAETVSFPSKTA
jgi:hypothetical protein